VAKHLFFEVLRETKRQPKEDGSKFYETNN
jgi:hypothetical protein